MELMRQKEEGVGYLLQLTVSVWRMKDRFVWDRVLLFRKVALLPHFIQQFYSNAFDCPKCPLSTASMTRFVSPGANHDNLSQQSVVFQLQQTFLDSLEYAADLHGLADRLESLAGLIISQQNQGLLSSASTSVASFVAQNVEVICSSAQSLMTFSNESVEALSCNLQDLLVEGAARPLKS